LPLDGSITSQANDDGAGERAGHIPSTRFAIRGINHPLLQFAAVAAKQVAPAEDLADDIHLAAQIGDSLGAPESGERTRVNDDPLQHEAEHRPSRCDTRTLLMMAATLGISLSHLTAT